MNFNKEFGGFWGVGVGAGVGIEGENFSEILSENKEFYFHVLHCEEAERRIFRATNISFNLVPESGEPKVQISGCDADGDIWLFDETDVLRPCAAPVENTPKFKKGDICYSRNSDWMSSVVKCAIVSRTVLLREINVGFHQRSQEQNRYVIISVSEPRAQMMRWEDELFETPEEAFD